MINLNKFKKYLISINLQINDDQIAELKDFDNKIGFNYDRKKTIIQFIKLNYQNWVHIWYRLQSIPNGTLEYNQLYYGEKEGREKWIASNNLKKKGLSNTIEYHLAKGRNTDEANAQITKIQSNRAKKSSNKIKGKIGVTARSIKFWIDKGLTKEEAKEKTKQIQSNGSLKSFKKRYGDELGYLKWKQRQEKWQKSLNNNPDNINIGYKRGHSLARYIDRAKGDEHLGKIYYDNYIKNLAGWHSASKQSLIIMKPIIEFCKLNNIECYYGADNKKEWIIHNNNKSYIYDFTIPLYGIIIEYNGETWHPNPSWEIEQWNKWVHPHTKQSATERYNHDLQKIKVAEENGWKVLVVFESSPDISGIMNILQEFLQIPK